MLRGLTGDDAVPVSSLACATTLFLTFDPGTLQTQRGFFVFFRPASVWCAHRPRADQTRAQRCWRTVEIRRPTGGADRC